MKRLIIIIASCILISNIIFAQQKRALIVTISNYPDLKENSWNDLHAYNDATMLETTLLTKGFDKNNIQILQDKNATKKGIETAFQTLISNSSKGDFIIIHFSCHGQQIEDLNGDEPDGLDEAIAAYNAPMVFPANGKYKFEEHVCDDELGIWLQSLANTIGPKGQILVNIDACHSGSATRGDEIVRGSPEPCVSDQFKKPANQTNTKGFGIESASPSSIEKNQGNGGKLIVISGSRAHESSYETRDENGQLMGTLTLAFCKAFIEADSSTTFHSLFNKVLTTMADITLRQTPTLEGEADYTMFNGGLIKLKPYYEIVEKKEDSLLVINAGSLAGIQVNDVIGFYAPGSNKFSRTHPEVMGKVTKSNPFFSEITLNKYFYIENTKAYWGVLVEKGISGSLNTVMLDVKTKSVKDSISRKFNGYNLVQLSDVKGDLIIREDAKTGLVRLIEPSTQLPPPDSIQVDVKIPGNMDKLYAAIKRYCQSAYIREIEMEDKDIKIDADLLPVKGISWSSDNMFFSKFSYDSAYFNTSLREYDANRQYVLWIKNTGKKPCYISAIEIQPDNKMNLLLPYKGMDATSYKLEPGESKTWLHIRKFTPPFGTESFKIFATSSVINLKTIISSQGNADEGTRGSMGPLETLVNESYMNTRGDGPSGFDADNSGTIKSIVFTVKP